MPNLYDPAQVERLIESNEKLDGTIDELRSELKYVKVVVRILVVLVLLVGLALARSFITATDLRHVVDQAQADREQTIASACAQFNAQRLEVRNAQINSLRALVPPAPTAEQAAALKVYADAVIDLLPYRDCSPAGIAEYYKHPPIDPATK